LSEKFEEFTEIVSCYSDRIMQPRKQYHTIGNNQKPMVAQHK